MDEITKNKLDLVEQKIIEANAKIDQIDKRISDVKMFPSIVLTVIGAIFIGLTIFAGITLKAERESLRNLEGDIRERVNVALGQALLRPDIILMGEIGKDLEGQTIPAELVTTDEEKKQIAFTICVKNGGNRASDPLFFKLYASDPIKAGAKSTDEEDFDFETYVEPAKVPMSGILPAGFSIRLNINLAIREEFEPIKDTYPMLIKVYYGAENPNIKRFRIKFR